MLTKEQATADAWLQISELVGREYFKEHFEGSTHSYPADSNEVEYEYFIGFEGDDESDLWTVFARVSVNRETEKVTILDYKLPNGERMKNPIKPVRWA